MTLDERAEEAINQVFEDTSVNEDETLRRLQSLREHIEMLMSSLG